MTAAALAAALLLVGAASAWGAFVQEGSPYPVGDEPYALTAADFNGDGRPDVVTMNGTSSDLSVFLRRAAGGFVQEAGSPVSVVAGSGPSSVAVGDFNNDGRLDLAVSRFVFGGVSVLLRQAGGGFANEAGSPVLSGTSMRALGTGDFNGDGRLDLAATLAGGGVQLLLRNPTNTTFTAGQSFGTGSGPVAMAVGDYNGDGLADLAVANYTSGTVSVLMRNSVNTGFAALAPIRVSNTPVGIDAADFDRDGRPDLAVASNAGVVDVLHRTATGFTRDQPIAIAGAVNDVVAADFDGDARPDLAASSYGAADTFSALLNPAPAPPQGLPDPVPHENVNALPKSGTVRIKLPGEDTFVVLTEGQQIPLGTTVDTRKSRVTIVAAAGGDQTSDFYAGLFKLSQTKGNKPITVVTLVEKLTGCTSKKKTKANAAAAKKKKRRLWGNGKGRFRTKGKHSAATVVGTKWLVEDRCTSTLTRVRRGRVKVRDFAKHKTVTVKAGKRYIARAKRR